MLWSLLFISGFRPSDLCENQSPETDSSDIYNQAKSSKSALHCESATLSESFLAQLVTIHLSRSDKVSFCDGSLLVVRPLTIDLNDISS